MLVQGDNSRNSVYTLPNCISCPAALVYRTLNEAAQGNNTAVKITDVCGQMAAERSRLTATTGKLGTGPYEWK